MKKREWIPYIIVVFALLTGAFYDYQITNFFYQKAPLFGLLFERFILIPVIMVPVVTFMFLYQEQHKWYYLLFAFLASLFSSYDILHFWISETYLIYGIVITGLVECFVFRYIGKILNQTTIEKILPFLKFYTYVLISSILITNFIKFGWGRIRYRDMQNVKQFCVWYVPCGLDGNYSFPSGHTTAFTSILCLLQYPRENKYKKVSLWIYIVITLFIILMPLSRMIMGAHFLSDTAMGFAVTYTMYLVFRKKYRKLGYI